MLISIHVHTENPFGFFFVPSLFCSFNLCVVFFFTEELVPTGPCITLSFA